MEYQKLLLGDDPYLLSVAKSSFGAHFHNEMEILYCKKGCFTIFIDKMGYDLRSNCAVFINTIEEHELIIENDETEILVVELGVSLLGDEFNQISKCKFLNPMIDLSCSKTLPGPVSNRLKEIFTILYKEYKSRGIGFTWMAKAGLFELSAIILRYFPMNQDANFDRQKRINHYLKIQKVFLLVEKKYQQPISLKEAADCVEYEMKSFCRIFKETTNMTFHKYLNMYRIDVATKLLQYRPYAINEIARLSGIPVPKTFCRVFHEFTGMTPTAYRKSVAFEPKAKASYNCL